MASIQNIKASDGSGNANIATVQSSRSAGATTIDVDTVLGINADGFAATMGTPHTFTDPVTGETITVISEDTAVDFIGHVDGSNLEIDTIAPGYTDGGSEVGDIVMIRPTTQWADEVADILGHQHKDDGSHSDITADSIVTDSLTVNGTATTQGWTALGDTPDTITALGNRSYSMVFNGNDLTDTLSKGMRLQTTRTVAAPDMCTDLEASSSQYYSRASGSLTGMTFTDDFVVSAWIKLESYPSNQAHIASRCNNTSGWRFYIDSGGAVNLQGMNAGSSNVSQVLSYQSIPLGRWVHVAAQLDMSTFTATTTTSYVMIDGVDVPARVARSGSNPTALIQAGNLEVGSFNGGSQYFDGKIAQVAIYSAKVTQATILASMNQALAGNETSLISAYSFDNSINDLNVNANNLTANNSAVATATDSPFAGGTTAGVTEYAIVTNTAFSTNSTITVQVPEGYAIPTSGGISAVLYSTHKTPYGFPLQASKWELMTTINSSYEKAHASAANFYVLPVKLAVPVGSWNLGYQAFVRWGGSTGAAAIHGLVDLTTQTTDYADSSLLDRQFCGAHYNYHTAANIYETGAVMCKERPVELSTQTTYSLATRTAAAAGGFISRLQGLEAATLIIAKCAYL